MPFLATLPSVLLLQHRRNPLRKTDMLMRQSGQTSPSVILQACGVCKNYGALRVLHAIDLKLVVGERVALMGPSGAGKSTLLNCLGGIETIDAGQLFFENHALHAMDDEQIALLRRQRIGTIFQFFHLLPTLSAAENIALPLRLNGVGQREVKQRVHLLLHEVGLSARADAFPHTLSGGEMQRIAIARALAVEPALLLADEPTGNLDSKTSDSILNLIAALCEQHHTALVMVTHDEASTRICQRVIQLCDGCVLDTASAS
jgi:putative ABC transport system ATP-binding protein